MSVSEAGLMRMDDAIQALLGNMFSDEIRYSFENINNDDASTYEEFKETFSTHQAYHLIVLKHFGDESKIEREVQECWCEYNGWDVCDSCGDCSTAGFIDDKLWCIDCRDAFENEKKKKTLKKKSKIIIDDSDYSDDEEDKEDEYKDLKPIVKVETKEEELEFINDKMKNITTASSLSLSELKKTKYINFTSDTTNIDVGDYVCYYTKHSPIIGRVSRRTAKTIWINEITPKLNNRIRYCNDTEFHDVTHEIYYWNINERINISSTEIKTTLSNKTLSKITNNFTVWHSVDYMR